MNHSRKSNKPLLITSISLLGLVALGGGWLFLSQSKPNPELRIPCGAHQVLLACKGRQSACTHNTLSFIHQDGSVRFISPIARTDKLQHQSNRPQIWNDTRPQGLFCQQNPGGNPLVVIEYSRGPGSFPNEIFFDWFTTEGVRLSYLGQAIQPQDKTRFDVDPTDRFSYIED